MQKKLVTLDKLKMKTEMITTSFILLAFYR